MSTDPVENSTPPEPQPPVVDAGASSSGAPAQESPAGEDFPRPQMRRVKIGTQRTGEQIKAIPQIASAAIEAPLPQHVPPPSKRAGLSPELQAELDEALGGMSIDQIVKMEDTPLGADLAVESRVRGRVAQVRQGDVFVELGGRNQGIAPLLAFSEPPPLGSTVEVMIVRYDAESGLYQVTPPGGAAVVEDWSQVAVGMTVEARITGHNKGGLECEVNQLRGFIPISQVSQFRVENLAPFVGEKMLCLVTEVNPERRNLVLSHRAILDREKEVAKEKLRGELEVGQVREGVVRSIRDFGAFVDLGGIDGLLHVSQLSWARVKHPSDVLQEGQKVTVKIHKIDPETGKLSLAMKELTESPWASVAQKYVPRTTVTGTVSKIMDFGAFVQLEPGIEGLVHISELAHKRVFRVGDIVQEGQQVDVQVVSVDPEKQRISLSIKAIQAKPEPIKKEAEPEPVEETPPPQVRKPSKPLKGGLGRASGGESIGLNW